MRSIYPALVFAVATLTCPSTVIRAQSAPAGTDRVEEDWKLVIADPDPAGAGPQVTTCMFPDDGDLTNFVAFNLNYRASPSFAAGGVEIQYLPAFFFEVIAGGWLLFKGVRPSVRNGATHEPVDW